MTLWVVRHARPLVAPGVCYGSLDVAADPEATRHAAQALSDALPAQLQVQCSPLRRCQQMAECLQALRPGLEVHVDARLREIDFGCWEGVPWDAIPRAAIDAWVADFGQHPFGGGESTNAVLGRVGAAWDALPDPGPSSSSISRSHASACVWLTHAGVAQALHWVSQGVRQLQRADQWPTKPPGYGAWLVYRRVDGRGVLSA